VVFVRRDARITIKKKRGKNYPLPAQNRWSSLNARGKKKGRDRGTNKERRRQVMARTVKKKGNRNKWDKICGERRRFEVLWGRKKGCHKGEGSILCSRKRAEGKGYEKDGKPKNELRERGRVCHGWNHHRALEKVNSTWEPMGLPRGRELRGEGEKKKGWKKGKCEFAHRFGGRLLRGGGRGTGWGEGNHRKTLPKVRLGKEKKGTYDTPRAEMYGGGPITGRGWSWNYSETKGGERLSKKQRLRWEGFFRYSTPVRLKGEEWGHLGSILNNRLLGQGGEKKGEDEIFMGGK